MRRFPSSWDKTLSALGFRRNTKRIKRDHYRRKHSRIEQLEVRAMLAGDTFVVTTLADQSDNDLTDGISLREAIVQADAAGGANTITFDETLFAGGAKTLLLGDTDGDGLIDGAEDPSQLLIDSDLSIEGPGSNQLTISGADDARVLKIDSNQELDVSIGGLTIAAGRADKGAGIHSHGNNLALDDVTFENNYAMTWDGTNNRFVAKQGGALNFQGNDNLDHSTLTITNSTFDGNYASHGGAIYSYGGYAHIEIDTTTFSNNHAFYLMDDQLDIITTSNFLNGFGGALNFTSYDLHNSGNKGSIEIKNSTLHHNEAERDGGAIASARSYFTLDIINSTISSNTAFRSGAIKVSYNQDVTITNSTITENTVSNWSSSGGIENLTSNPANLTLHNTIVAGNKSPTGGAYDLRGSLEAASSHNIIGRWTQQSSTPTGLGNQISDTIDPGLMPLGDYGGPTLTHAIGSDSLAIDAGSNAIVPDITDDQRGSQLTYSDRLRGDSVDVGAFEFASEPIESQAAVSIASEAPIDGITIIDGRSYSKSWVASNDAGFSVMVWIGDGVEGVGVYYSILNPITQDQSQPRLVDLGIDASTIIAPKVVIDHEGNFAITWVDSDNGNYRNWLRRYTLSGSPIDTLPVLISSGSLSAAVSLNYSVTANEPGRILVVWQDSNENILFRRFTTQGLSLDAAERTITSSSIATAEAAEGVQLPTSGRSAVVKSDGGFFLFWGTESSLYITEFGSNGFQQGESVAVVTSDNDLTTLDIALGPNDSPYFAWLESETQTVSVPQDGLTGSQTTKELLVSNLNADDNTSYPTTITSELSYVHTYSGSSAEGHRITELAVTTPSLAIDGHGRFGIAWHRYRNSYAQFETNNQGLDETQYRERNVEAAWFNNQGNAIYGRPIITDHLEGTAFVNTGTYPTLATDAAGNFRLTQQLNNTELHSREFSLPQIVSLDGGILTIDDSANQFEELTLGTELFDGNQRVTFNGIMTQFNASEVEKIIIQAGHGDNRIDLSHLDETHFDLQGAIDTTLLTGPIEVYAGGGNDVLFAPSIGAVLHGEAGDDRIIGSDSVDVLIGGEGKDLLVGGGSNDTLMGGHDDDTLKGGEGNDAIYGGDGDDYLLGEAGADFLHGEAGNDRLDGGKNDDATNELDGGIGDDQYLITKQSDLTLGSSVEITDADGIDTIDFSGWIGTVGATLDLSSNSTQSLIGVGTHTLLINSGAMLENVIGTPNDDVLTGNDANNRLEGREGNDDLLGAGGNDTLLGHAGNDNLYAGIKSNDTGGGNDVLEGGFGDDFYHLFEEPADDPNVGLTVNSIITIDDTDGTNTLNAENLPDLGTDSEGPIRIVLNDSTIDQTWGNVTLLAGSFEGVDEIDGHNPPEAASLTPVVDDTKAPQLEISAWSDATELIQWTHPLVLSNSSATNNEIPSGDTVFFTLGEDAPEGMLLDESTNTLSWLPGPGQEGDHTFTVFATRFGSSILRTSTELTLSVANSATLPQIVAGSLKVKNPSGISTTTSDAIIEGEVSFHDPLDFIDVSLTYTNGTNTLSVPIELTVDKSDPYRGRFEYAPTGTELTQLLDGSLSASLVVSAVPRSWDESLLNYVLYPDGTNGSVNIALDTTLDTEATISSFELENFATISLGKITTDPTFIGTVTNDQSLQDLSVKFFLDNGVGVDDTEIGRTRTDATGAFRFTPDDYSKLGFADSDTHKALNVYAVIFDRGPLDILEEETDITLKPSISFTLVKHAAPTITFDTPTSAINLELTGGISWGSDPYAAAHNLEDVTIELSYDVEVETENEDGSTTTSTVTVEGIAVTDGAGEFSYIPTGLVKDAPVIFTAKAFFWDDFEDNLIASLEKTLPFTPTIAASVAPIAIAPTLKYEINTGEASDPTITGNATLDGAPLGGIYVEYSLGVAFDDPSFVEADGFVLTDEEGVYEFTPIGLELGTETTVYVRAATRSINVEDDTSTTEEDDAIVTENWLYQTTPVSIPVTLVSPTLPTIDGLDLVNNTGALATSPDNISSDPTIRGQVTNYHGDMSVIKVEYMVNGIVAGELTPEEDGSFEFLADGYSSVVVANEDNNEIRVRAIAPDYSSAAPDFEDGLLSIDSDGDRTSGWFAADYFGTGEVGDANYEAAGWSNTINEDWFNEILASEGVGLQGTWHNSSFTRDWDGSLSSIKGAWATYSFTLDPLADSQPTATVVTTGGADPTFTGTLTNIDGTPLAGRTLEFYINGNTEPDGTAVTSEVNGAGESTYSYSPPTFTEANSLVIKLVEPVYNGTDPKLITAFDGNFSVAADTELLVSSLALANALVEADESTLASSYDPTLKGQIEKPGDVALQIVEFDYDQIGDAGYGIADSWTYTDALGGFEHSPTGIAINANNGDTLSVRSRVVSIVIDGANNTTYRTIGSWSEALEWTYVEIQSLQFTSLQLEEDTRTTSGQFNLDYEVLDGITSNPNLVGQVVKEVTVGTETKLIPIAYQSIEFDHDGDGVADGIVSTDAEGRFRYVPDGLTIGTWDLKARVVDEDIAQDTSLTTGWKSVTRTGRPEDISSGVGFELVDPFSAYLPTIAKLNSNVDADPTITGQVKWLVGSTQDSMDPGASNVYLEFKDASGFRLGAAVTDENGSFTFLPVGLLEGVSRTINVYSEQDPDTSIGTITYDFTPVTSTVGNEKFELVDFSTAELSGIIVASETFIPQYVEVQFKNTVDIDGVSTVVTEVEVVPVEISYTGSSSNVEYLLSHEIELTSIDADTLINFRPVGYDTVDDHYVVGDWLDDTDGLSAAVRALALGPNLSFENDPAAVVPDTDNQVTTSQLSGKIDYAKTGDFNFRGDTISWTNVTWEFEVEYDLDGDGFAEYVFPIDDPDANYTHELPGLDPGLHDIQSRVIGYATFDAIVPVGNETVTEEQNLRAESEWVEESITFTNPGPSVDVENNSGVATNVSHPVPTEATIVGSITSPIGATLTGMTVEVDENLDGVAEGSVYVGPDGTFEYTAKDTSIGENRIQLRAIDPYSASTNLVGDWTELTFTLMPEVAPEVTSLALETYQDVAGQQITDAPVIVGKVTLPTNTQALQQWVEFDYDGDDEPDGTASLDSFGNFEFRPTNLAYGDYTNFRVRTMVQLAGQQLEGDWSSEYQDPQSAPAPITLSFVYEPNSLPEISGDIEVLDVALGLVAGRATLNGFGYAGKVAISVQQAGTEVSSLTAYSNESGRFEFELLELSTGLYDLVITPQLVDTNAATGYYAGIPRTTEDIDYSPIALVGTPELDTFDIAYHSGAVAGKTSDPTLKGTVDLSAYGEAPPQLYVQITYDNGGVAGIQNAPVRSDGTFEWTPVGLVEGDSYQYTARTKIWNPQNDGYDIGTVSKVTTFDLVQSENQIPTINSLVMHFNESAEGAETHTSADATFSGTVDNDGRKDGLTVYFDHNQDGIIDGQTKTLSDGSFFYRAEGIEASDALTQTMTAWVVETDYWGETLTSDTETRDFVLTRAPILREFSYDSVNNRIVGSLFSETDATHLWIEYELFGNSLPGGAPPADVDDYVLNYAGVEREFVSVDTLGNFTIALPAGITGNLSVALRGVDLSDADLPTIPTGEDPSSIDSLVYEEHAVAGGWDLLAFEAGASVLPSDVALFKLAEDTGATDDISSNPSVSGKVKPFELVEIVTRKETATGTGIYEQVAIDRVTADAAGNFVFASPYFNQADLATSYQVVTRAIAFDLANQTESAGNDSAPVTFEYVANGTSISASASVAGVITGSVSANGTHGRVAGLRVEFDIDLGQGLDGNADGYAITDSNGDYSYQVYGFVAQQTVNIVAQVIEWDPVAKEFTDPGFNTSLDTAIAASFIADADAAADPTLSEQATGGTAGLERAGEAIEDAVRTVLAQNDLNWLEDANGNLELIVWQTDLLGRGGLAEAGPEGDSSNLITIDLDLDPEVGWIDGVDSYDDSTTHVNSIPLTGSSGSFNAKYDASRTFTDLGNNEWELLTTFEIWLEDYSHTNDSGLELNDATDQAGDDPSYSFEFKATGSVDEDNYFVIDSYDTTEESNYDFYTVVESFTEDGTLYRTETTAGSYSLVYKEWNDNVALGAVTRKFDSSETTDLETWVTENDPDAPSGSSYNLSDHSTYYEKLTDIGEITAAGTSGTRTVDAQGFYESTVDATYLSYEELDGEPGANLFDSSSDSSTDTYSYRGDLYTSADYSTGGATSTDFNLKESTTSSYLVSGNGTYGRADESGNWHYSANGTARSDSTLNGKSYEGTYSSVNATLDSSSNLTHSGSGGGSGSYSEVGTIAGNSDTGTYTNNYTYSLAANANSNASLSSYNEDFTVRGKQSISSSVNSTDRGEVEGTLLTADDNTSSSTDYGTQIRSNAGANANSASNFTYNSLGESSTDGNYLLNVNGSGVVASQSSGEFEDNSTETTVTTPFRNNSTVESSLTFTSDGNFSSKIAPGEEEIFSVTGENIREEKSEYRSTEYFAVNTTDSEGNPGEANEENFSLTKTQIKDRSFEEYRFENSNDVDSRDGQFENESKTTVEVTESLVVENEVTNDGPNNWETSKYTSEKDSFLKNTSSSEGPFSDINGESEAYATVDESFVTFGKEKTIYEAEGERPVNHNGEWALETWDAISRETITFDTKSETNGYVELVNGEAIDSLMNVELENDSIVNTFDRSNVNTKGSKLVNGKRTSFNEGGSVKEKVRLELESSSEGTVKHDGSSLMSVISTEEVKASTKNNYHSREGAGSGNIFFIPLNSSYAFGSTTVTLDRETTIEGEVSQGGATPDPSATYIDLRNPSSSYDVSTDSKTTVKESARWNRSEASGDLTSGSGGNYRTSLGGGQTKTFTKLTESTDSTVNQYESGDQYEQGTFFAKLEVIEDSNTGSSRSSYREGGQSGYAYTSVNTNSSTKPNIAEGWFTVINGVLKVTNKDDIIKPLKSSTGGGDDTGTYKVTSGNGTRSTSDNGHSGSSSSSSSEGGGGKNKNESKSNSFAREKDVDGNVSKSNTDSDAQSKTVVDGEKAASTTSNSYNKDSSTKIPNKTTSYNTYSNNSQSVSAEDNNRSLKITNESGSSKTIDSKSDPDDNNKHFALDIGNTVVAVFPYREWSTTDYNTNEMNYSSSHTVDSYGNASDGNFSAKREIASGTRKVYRMDVTDTFTDSVGTITDTYYTKVDFKQEDFITINESGEFYDDGGRRQSGTFDITSGNRGVSKDSIHNHSHKDTAPGIIGTHGNHKYSKNFSNHTTLSGGYDIYGNDLPSSVKDTNSGKTTLSSDSIAASGTLWKLKDSSEKVGSGEDLKYKISHTYFAKHFTDDDWVQDDDYTYFVDIDPPAEASTPPNSQQNKEPVNAESLDVGIPSYTEFYDTPEKLAGLDEALKPTLNDLRREARQRILDSIPDDELDPNAIDSPEAERARRIAQRPDVVATTLETTVPEDWRSDADQVAPESVYYAALTHWAANIYEFFTPIERRIKVYYEDGRIGYDLPSEPPGEVIAGQGGGLLGKVLKGAKPKHFDVKVLPALRQQYVDAVEELSKRGAALRAQGKTSEQIARTLHAERRALGEKFKDLTPPDKLAEIYARNLEKYGDKLGPSIEYLRGKGKTWEDIIESASRPGGKDLGF